MRVLAAVALGFRTFGIDSLVDFFVLFDRRGRLWGIRRGRRGMMKMDEEEEGKLEVESMTCAYLIGS